MDIFKRNVGSKTGETAESAVSGAEPIHVTGEEFTKTVLGSGLPAIVDFWAEWCGPCHAIAPSVTRLAAEYDGRALVAKLNADDYPEIVQRYGIMGIPTLIFFKNGKEVDRQVGMTSYGTLKGKLDRLLA